VTVRDTLAIGGTGNAPKRFLGLAVRASAALRGGVSQRCRRQCIRDRGFFLLARRGIDAIRDYSPCARVCGVVIAWMAASHASVIARCSARKYRKFTFNSQARALGHLSSLTALIFRAQRSDLICCLSHGIPVIELGIATVTAQHVNILRQFLGCCWR
jgi:hypothetical protein